MSEKTTIVLRDIIVEVSPHEAMNLTIESWLADRLTSKGCQAVLRQIKK